MFIIVKMNPYERYLEESNWATKVHQTLFTVVSSMMFDHTNVELGAQNQVASEISKDLRLLWKEMLVHQSVKVGAKFEFEGKFSSNHQTTAFGRRGHLRL